MKPPKTVRNSLGMTFVEIPAGTFVMGLKGFYEPLHEVSISSFWMSQYEVTNAQFEHFKKRQRPVEAKHDDQPMTRLTWEEATEFCVWLSKKENVLYRLPTEAEWEYAARGGLHQKLYPWGDSRSTRGRGAFGMNEAMPVGSYPPNGYHLYDMAGNVEEFVSDWFDPHYYERSPKQDPKGPDKPQEKFKDLHIYRGGSFTLYEGYCGTRSLWTRLDRIWEPDDPNGSDGSGFRVVMVPQEQKHGLFR